MTRARALKQVIRARAAKTGERYTQARRHVLAILEKKSSTPAPKPVTAPVSAAAPPAPRKRMGISDAKVRERTGDPLDHWFAILDRFGGTAKGHSASARHLHDDHGVDGWYAQGITVAYEQARGVRVVNQRGDGAYEVSVSKVVSGTTADVIKVLSDPRLRRQWTTGVDSSLVSALEASLAGPAGKPVVVRADGLGRHRYKWGATTVQLYLEPKAGNKVSLVASNMKLQDAAAVDARRAQWRTALEAIAAQLRK